ncbi:two-component system, NarL family, sensor histidine kinase UhpB [Pseudomonas sp. NFPP10]|uniref:sensor histidine kinase n=1 Tax=unclassified Pseudomonas TaxID=196821 RepID=UPI00088AE083|nr:MULTISPECIES: histidine kinase [unclassified Pseudomonas]SDA25181.1 two-component system, NarL family, sensor histidine kinase UhpB [Pseudomonas sp. NFPP12]SEL75123.1 two-component system, NarL family, sensor histidine kinase UhpB [Pseudomonas sp. NFPP10]SFJ51457.1 two-component system, NarL family, sensor histidine kinase UhpB [Pseudomonas sp. NFPP08]SFM90171.1 two-component system, NarL family, sensor histidine kinase UhpB [Pseudomonas sp. NFPP05]SFX63834.1 two-component system, NarL fami
MSALWRINLWVSAFFAVVTLACAALLLHQAVADVERELQSAEAVVEYLSDSAARNPAGLQPHLTQSLRHVRVHWLAPDEAARMPEEAGLDAWLGRQLFSERRHSARELDLGDGRRVLIAVDARDEIDEVWDSLQQLLSLCGLALLLSLLTIRWAVRCGMGLLDDLLRALQQVSGGQLAVRLREAGLPEARQLAGHFNRMTATLEQTRADNTQLTQALLAVQERERTYLAQTLHDDLGQYLAGIRAQVCLLRMVADQPTVVEHTAQALELNCERLQQGFRALVQDLYPVVLQHLPLAEAFGLLVSQWQDSQGIDCQLRVGADLPALPSASKTHLYRLLQEALTNVARHAGASQVRVRLQRSARGLRLLVRDNGRGARQPQRPGVGLHSMAERARSLGGELHILSRPGAGWALALNMPLNMPMEA